MGNVQAPRGTHDIFGDEHIRFEEIYSAFAEISQNFGFKGIETPIFESIKVFDRTLGDSSDIVSKEMYVFEDRGGDQLCLRPEGTAGIARAFISNSWSRDLPLKLYYQGPMFRYERPQKGRYREFHQIGVEALGVESAIFDAEVIGLGQSLIERLGLSDICSLEINSLGDRSSRDSYRTALVEYYNNHKDKLSEDSLTRLEKNPLRILDSKDKSDIEINKDAPKLSDHLSESSQEKLKQVKALLDKAGIKYSVNEKLVRGLDYYNDVVFEFVTNELGSQNAVIAGGRYDSLMETMGGPATPGVGFAAGVERLSLLMDQIGVQCTSNRAKVVFVPMGAEAELSAYELSQTLRKDNRLSSHFIYSGNFSKRMKKADKLNADYVVIIGDDEVANSTATLKILKSGEQETVSQNKLVARLIELLG